ncbi:MAG: antibiotic biosynthesis monooxygenase [Actinomycetota bacterium]
MIVIGGHLRLDPTKRDEAIAAATEMMAATHAEEGCVTYVFSASFDDPGLFHLFEEWETAEALAAHGQAPHMAVFQQKMAGFGVSERSLHRYVVTERAPL